MTWPLSRSLPGVDSTGRWPECPLDITNDDVGALPACIPDGPFGAPDDGAGLVEVRGGG